MVWATKIIMCIIGVMFKTWTSSVELWLVNLNPSLKLVNLWLVITEGSGCKIG